MVSGARLMWLIVLLGLTPASAEMYKWVDRHGKVHLSDTVEGIPDGSRGRVEERTSLPPLPSRPLSTRTPPAGVRSATPLSYTVPLYRDGNTMLVEAVIDGKVLTRLLVDTGAEFTVLSTAAARRLRLDVSQAAVIPLRSASGVFFAAMLKVPLIAVGEATATDVDVIVYDATPGLDGLLGMSFLDNFQVTISASTERLVLTSLAQDATVALYDGRPKDWWLRKFRFYRTQLDSLQQHLAGRSLAELERTLRYFRTELGALDRQAVQAGVPRDWRH